MAELSQFQGLHSSPAQLEAFARKRDQARKWEEEQAWRMIAIGARQIAEQREMVRLQKDSFNVNLTAAILAGASTLITLLIAFH